MEHNKAMGQIAYQRELREEESAQLLQQRRAERAAAEALKKEERDRERRSLALRLVQSKKEKEMELTSHREKMDALHRDFQLRREDWLAARATKHEEEERSRKSIALRLESWRSQRMIEEKVGIIHRAHAEQDAQYQAQADEDEANATSEADDDTLVTTVAVSDVRLIL